MHELSIAMSLLEVAEEEAARLNVHAVAIRLKLGPLSGVVKEALLGAYDLARAGSPLENCRLVIQEMPIVVHCQTCDADQTLDTCQEMICPACGSPTPDVITGRELEVVGLEVLDGPANPAGRSTPASAQAE